MTSEAHVLCKKCSTNLPEGAHFCLECGEPLIVPENRAARGSAKKGTKASSQRAHNKAEWWMWLLFIAMIGLTVWASFSRNPAVHKFQEFVGWSHEQAILDASVSVQPLNFSYYKFTVPAGAVDVSLTGQFSTNDSKNVDKGKIGGSKMNRDNKENQIEAYVLTDTAFVVWRKGYSTGTQYESGKVAQAAMNAELPPGFGIYYLVFNNKFSPHQPKTVQASVLLRYKSWLPDYILRMKDELWDWLGLNE